MWLPLIAYLRAEETLFSTYKAERYCTQLLQCLSYTEIEWRKEIGKQPAHLSISQSSWCDRFPSGGGPSGIWSRHRPWSRWCLSGRSGEGHVVPRSRPGWPSCGWTPDGSPENHTNFRHGQKVVRFFLSNAQPIIRKSDLYSICGVTSLHTLSKRQIPAIIIGYEMFFAVLCATC